VWMTNHLLASPEFEHSISKVFQSVGRRYVQYFNLLSAPPDPRFYRFYQRATCCFNSNK